MEDWKNGCNHRPIHLSIPSTIPSCNLPFHILPDLMSPAYAAPRDRRPPGILFEDSKAATDEYAFRNEGYSMDRDRLESFPGFQRKGVCLGAGRTCCDCSFG